MHADGSSVGVDAQRCRGTWRGRRNGAGRERLAAARPGNGKRPGPAAREQRPSWPPAQPSPPKSSSRTSAWRACHGHLMTGRSCCRNRAGSSSRSPAPGTRSSSRRWPGRFDPLRLVLPLLPRPRPGPRTRGDAARHPPRGGGVFGRPGIGRTADAVPLGRRRSQHRDPVEPDRQPVPPGGGMRRRRSLHRTAARADRVPAPRATRSPTSRSGKAPHRKESSGRA